MGRMDNSRQNSIKILINIPSLDHKGGVSILYAALNAATILCMTRIDIGYANAGFPFKLGEFLATGKPVIASRVSDVECMLENRREAMLVEPGDSDGIVATAEYLIGNPDQAAAIGMKGRAKAKILFDHRKQGQALLTFLRRL